ncbi:MAG: Na+/H+ antiporter NhaC family protein [Bacteroidetes bacterium]|nr:Na+/H+ antiporter NhaC family protein [Bacteroidota bacterium]
MPGKILIFILSFVMFLGVFYPLKGEETPFVQQDDIAIEFPFIIIQHIPFSIEIEITDPELAAVLEGDDLRLKVGDEYEDVRILNGKGTATFTARGKTEISFSCDAFYFGKGITPVPLWMSILPPLIAILFALIFREVYSALFAGLLVGTTILHFYAGSNIFIALFQGIFSIADTYLLEAMFDRGHLSIIIFSMLIGAMVNLITRNGGMNGVVNLLSKYAKNDRSGQFITWLMGIIIFFDDYANTLVVGNTMRPVTDRLKISREKLAYLVDSTAAPIASIAFVTTWIGAELSYIQDGIDVIGLDENAYMIFFNSLAYSFYPIFTLVFILFIIFRGVDFGPMLKAERKARQVEDPQAGGHLSFSNELNKLEVDGEVKARWFNAVIPVLVIIFGTLAGLISTGWDPEIWNNENIAFGRKISATIGNADSYTALLWSSLSSVLVAMVLTLSQRILSLKESIDSLINGFRTMLTAVLILILAWSVALITEHMHTATFISNSMLEMSLSPYFVPAITFILAALVSFSTGSSWGTMAILYPLMLPATWLITQDYGMEYDTSMLIFYNVVACVLTGSVLGDHCSPISDTTILSSLASSCNHIEHVRTQLPYALTVGTVTILAGTIPAAYGISSYILFPTGLIILFIVVLFLGKKVSKTQVQSS